MLRKPASIMVATVLMGLNAQAATLTDLSGAVFTSQGFEFQQAQGVITLNPGDRVRTGQGTVQIVYDNGCIEMLKPNQMAVVLSVAPSCQSALAKTQVAPKPLQPVDNILNTLLPPASP